LIRGYLKSKITVRTFLRFYFVLPTKRRRNPTRNVNDQQAIRSNRARLLFTP